jgi:hypothetical protein
LRAGQVFVPWGHENPLHAHQLPFVNRSLFADAVFGGEALSEFGLEARWVPPLSWFFELRGAVFNGDDAALFAGPEEWDLAYHGGFDALWDVSDGGTIAVSGAYLGGPNASGTTDASRWSHLGEYQYAEREAAMMEMQGIRRGAYGYAMLKFARRWWIQGRYDSLNESEASADTQRASFMLAFVPSEFSALRFQTSYVDTPEDQFVEYLLQLNFIIGSHPAHNY